MDTPELLRVRVTTGEAWIELSNSIFSSFFYQKTEMEKPTKSIGSRVNSTLDCCFSGIEAKAKIEKDPLKYGPQTFPTFIEFNTSPEGSGYLLAKIFADRRGASWKYSHGPAIAEPWQCRLHAQGH